MRVSIYCGLPYQDNYGIGQTGAIILHLMQDFLHKGYCVYADNFYNSVRLTRKLSENNTYICGTLCSDRKENPKDVTKKKISKGEMIQRSCNGITVCKLKDKRDVLMISNKHIVEMVEVTNKRGIPKQKPNVVRDYNLGMSGIDRSDQMISYYDSLHKTIRWYKKIGLHLIDIYLFNAHALYTTSSPRQPMTLLQFRENVIKSLIGKQGLLMLSQNQVLQLLFIT